MHDVGPLDRIGQIASRAVDKENRFLSQHCGQSRMQGKSLYFLKAEANDEVGFPSNGISYGQDKGFNPAVGAKTRTYKEQFDRSHRLAPAMVAELRDPRPSASASLAAIVSQEDVCCCQWRNFSARIRSSVSEIPAINSAGAITQQAGSFFDAGSAIIFSSCAA